MLLYNRVMQIIPTILEPNAELVIEQLKKLSPYFTHFQIDIQDGIYTQSKTSGIQELYEYVSKHTILFPDKTFNIDFMVEEPEKDLAVLPSLFRFLPIVSAFVHEEKIQEYNSLKEQYPQFAIGLSVNPGDDVRLLLEKNSPELIPIIQIMTVNPGPQGQSFIRDSLNKIDRLLELNYRYKIYIDGSVNEQSLPIITGRKNRPSVACVGSFLTKTNDLNSHLESLKKYGDLG